MYLKGQFTQTARKKKNMVSHFVLVVCCHADTLSFICRGSEISTSLAVDLFLYELLSTKKIDPKPRKLLTVEFVDFILSNSEVVSGKTNCC